MPAYGLWLQSVYRLVVVRLIMRFTYIVDMGFKEIYLLGADCNFPKGKQIHFQDYGVPDTTIDTARERNIAGYKEVKKQMNQYGFTVFNATRGGALEVFERVNLDDLLKEDK